MIGPTATAEQSQIPTEETRELRVEFCRWLYFDEYEHDTPAGTLAQQIHRADDFAYTALRNRSSARWVAQVAKRGWKVDPELLMLLWREWREAHCE